MHSPDIVIEVFSAFREVGEITIRQVGHQAFHILARQLDEVIGDAVADAATAGMQHDPDLVVFIQADFNEVIAAAQRAHLTNPVAELAKRFEQVGMLLCHGREPRLEWLGSRDQSAIKVVLVAPGRNIAADLVKHLLQRFLVDIVGGERELAGQHAAAYVHTHRCRDDGLVRGNHRTDSRASAKMHIRHSSNVMVNEGQRGDIG